MRSADLKYLIFLLLSYAVIFYSSPSVWSSESMLDAAIAEEISQHFAGARVDVLSAIRFQRNLPSNEIEKVRFISENGRGDANLMFETAAGSVVGSVQFAAFKKTFVAKRRVQPGETIHAGDFDLQEVNVANGLAHDSWGLFVSNESALKSTEAKQTILEGQFLTSNQVRNAFDVRRGDSLKVKLISGEIALSTLGVVQEPGYIGESVRVITAKSKREFTGRLTAHNTVEVSL